MFRLGIILAALGWASTLAHADPIRSAGDLKPLEEARIDCTQLWGAISQQLLRLGLVSDPAQRDAVAKQIAAFPGLFQAMVNGAASAEAIDGAASLYTAHGIALLHLPESVMGALKLPPETRAPWDRYGSKAGSVLSRPVSGEEGQPGGVEIKTGKPEEGDVSQTWRYHGKPHTHDVTHLTAVLAESGAVFVIEAETPQGKRLVAIPVKRGDVLLIPANKIHTFYTGTGEFRVLSFTTKVVPTESGNFLKLTPRAKLKGMPFVDYRDFLDERRAP